MTIPVIMVDPHFWKASALFNPNAFPPHVRGEALVCGDRLAILTHSVEIVSNEPALNRPYLLGMVHNNPAFAGFTPRKDKPAVLIFHNLNFVSGLYSALISVKSLLDLYSRLIARLLVPSATVFGFNKGVYKGRKLSGGRLLTWIEDSAPRTFQNRDKLTSVFLSHIDDWVNTAVAHRDAVVHDGYVQGLQEVMIQLDKQVGSLRETDVILPKMADGVAVTDYCARLLTRTRTLVAETLVLLPDVELSLLSLDKG